MRPTVVELAVLVALAGVGYWWWSRPIAQGEFDGNPERFFVTPVDEFPDVEQFHRRGKVLMLDADNRLVDPMQDYLPDEVRARTPEEVGTVGLVRCQESLSGYYIPFLVKGFNHSCQVQLIALPSLRMIANTGTALSPPTRVRLPFWNRHAQRPTKHLATTIAEMPDLGREPQ